VSAQKYLGFFTSKVKNPRVKNSKKIFQVKKVKGHRESKLKDFSIWYVNKKKYFFSSFFNCPIRVKRNLTTLIFLVIKKIEHKRFLWSTKDTNFVFWSSPKKSTLNFFNFQIVISSSILGVKSIFKYHLSSKFYEHSKFLKMF
jgi:hypothetical protein